MVRQPTPGELADMADGEVLNERFNPALHAPGEAEPEEPVDMFTDATTADNSRRGEQAVVTRLVGQQVRSRTRRIRWSCDQWRAAGIGGDNGQQVGARLKR